MNKLAFTVGNYTIVPPSGIPTGGLSETQHIIQVGITIFLSAIAILSLASIIWAGLRMIISAGEKTAVANARTQIIYSIIGLIVALVAFFVIHAVEIFFGIPLS